MEARGVESALVVSYFLRRLRGHIAIVLKEIAVGMLRAEREANLALHQGSDGQCNALTSKAYK